MFDGLRAWWRRRQEAAVRIRAAKRMVHAADIDMFFGGECPDKCKFCRREMPLLWPKEVRTSPTGEVFIHHRAQKEEAHGDACLYCGYVGQGHPLSESHPYKQTSLGEYCEKYKFVAPEGARYP